MYLFGYGVGRFWIEGLRTDQLQFFNGVITKGTEIYVRKVAPLGDPIEITVRGYELTLRKADADLIETN